MRLQQNDPVDNWFCDSLIFEQEDKDAVLYRT